MENYLNRVQLKILDMIKNFQIPVYQPVLEKFVNEYFHTSQKNLAIFQEHKDANNQLIETLLRESNAEKSNNQLKFEEYLKNIENSIFEIESRHMDIVKSFEEKKHFFNEDMQLKAEDEKKKYEKRINKNTKLLQDKCNKLHNEQTLLNTFFKNKITEIDQNHYDDQKIDTFFNDQYFKFNQILWAEEDNLYSETKELKNVEELIKLNFNQKNESISKNYNDNIIRNNTNLRKNRDRLNAKNKYYSNRMIIEKVATETDFSNYLKKLDSHRINNTSSLTEDLIKARNNPKKYRLVTRERIHFQLEIKKENENVRKFFQNNFEKLRLKYDYLQALEKYNNSIKNAQIEYSISFNKLKKEFQSNQLKFKLDYDLAMHNINSQISELRIHHFFDIEKKKIEERKAIYSGYYRAYEVLLTLNKSRESIIRNYQSQMKDLETFILRNNVGDKIAYLNYLKNNVKLNLDTSTLISNLKIDREVLDYNQHYAFKEKKYSYQKKIIEANFENINVKNKSVFFSKINIHQYSTIKNLVYYHFNNLKELIKLHKSYMQMMNSRKYIRNFNQVNEFLKSIDLLDGALKQLIHAEHIEFTKNYNFYLTKKIQLLFGEETKTSVNEVYEKYNLKKKRIEEDIAGIEDNNKTIKNKIMRLSYEILMIDKESERANALPNQKNELRSLRLNKKNILKEQNKLKITLLSNNNKIEQLKDEDRKYHKKYVRQVKKIDARKRKNARVYYETIEISKTKINRLSNYCLNFFSNEYSLLSRIQAEFKRNKSASLDLLFNYNKKYSSNYIRLENYIQYIYKNFEDFNEHIFFSEKKIVSSNQTFQQKFFKKTSQSMKNDLNDYKILLENLTKKKIYKTNLQIKNEEKKYRQILIKNYQNFTSEAVKFQKSTDQHHRNQEELTKRFIDDIELLEQNKIQIDQNYQSSVLQAKSSIQTQTEINSQEYERIRNNKPKNLDFKYLENQYKINLKKLNQDKNRVQKEIRKKIKMQKQIYTEKMILINKKIKKSQKKLIFLELYKD